MQFSLKYLLAALALFISEVFIALYIRDAWIRPYGGDFLVVWLLYCFLRAFIQIKVQLAVILVLSFAFLIEFLQFFRIIDLLGLEKVPAVNIVLGSHFEIKDLVIYSLAAVSILLVESMRNKI